MRIRSHVLEHPAAEATQALAHFRGRLAFEADCADVYADIAAGITGFTVVDCRTAEQFAAGHVPGAVNLPHRRISAEALATLLPPDDLLVTYCNGPHCNASTRGALRLVELGRRVKEMPGGLEGWRSEGLPTETGIGCGNGR
jgi:rhodanese-related sulfurtransferase